MGKQYQGGCLCGNIRFTAIGEAKKPHTCSCKMCQKHSGAITQAWVEFDKADVSWDGPGGMPSLWRSSDFSCRSFCNICGSTLGAIDDEPVVALVLGVFDSNNRQALKPVAHSYKSKQPKWWHVEVDS